MRALGFKCGRGLAFILAAVWGGSTAQGGYVFWVGYQDDTQVFNQNEASFHDGNQWFGYGVPGAGDVAAFWDTFDPQDNGIPRIVHFGDYTVTSAGSPPVSIPGRDADLDYVDVVSGEYTFDLGGRRLDVRPVENFSALIVGTRASFGGLTVRGGGTLHARSARVGDSSSEAGERSRGLLHVQGPQTVFDVEGYLQVGGGETIGNMVVEQGATAVVRREEGGGGGLFVGDSLSDYGPGDSLVVRGAGSVLRVVDVPFYVDGEASVVVTDGGRVEAGFGLDLGAGASLSGDGTVVGDVYAADGSTVSPGNSPGILTIDGNLDMYPGSKLVIELGGAGPGTGHDQLIVTGTVWLDGSVLELVAAPGYVPQPGDAFEFLRADGILGSFDSILDASGLGLGLTSDGGALRATVVPEPSASGVAGLSGLALLRRRRRAAPAMAA